MRQCGFKYIALLVSTLVFVGGCAEEAIVVEKGPLFSTLSELERAEVREALRHFRSSSPDGLDLTFIVSTIVNDMRRYFPQQSETDDFRVDGFSYNLTEALA